ncbi:hypothetical protein Fmac_021260 [Flemingia macrophylla]|uniref:Uncharacterized protein n=1 Tax=Flemingia macrophylla TaxID=520843 RepID=A0ABD1LWC7_9FABA
MPLHDTRQPMLEQEETAYDSSQKGEVVAIHGPRRRVPGGGSLVGCHCWLLMWATTMGLLIQVLLARLGVAIERHLAEQEEYPRWARIMLWLMIELALIGFDIQEGEVIGSAVAIKILSNDVVPLWVGVVITAFDW